MQNSILSSECVCYMQGHRHLQNGVGNFRQRTSSHYAIMLNSNICAFLKVSFASGATRVSHLADFKLAQRVLVSSYREATGRWRPYDWLGALALSGPLPSSSCLIIFELSRVLQSHDDCNLNSIGNIPYSITCHILSSLLLLSLLRRLASDFISNAQRITHHLAVSSS